jgi:hypothetical protein
MAIEEGRRIRVRVEQYIVSSENPNRYVNENDRETLLEVVVWPSLANITAVIQQVTLTLRGGSNG